MDAPAFITGCVAHTQAPGWPKGQLTCLLSSDRPGVTGCNYNNNKSWNLTLFPLFIFSVSSKCSKSRRRRNRNPRCFRSQFRCLFLRISSDCSVLISRAHLLHCLTAHVGLRLSNSRFSLLSDDSGPSVLEGCGYDHHRPWGWSVVGVVWSPGNIIISYTVKKYDMRTTFQSVDFEIERFV